MVVPFSAAMPWVVPMLVSFSVLNACQPVRSDPSSVAARFIKAYFEAKSLCIAVDIRDAYGIEFLAITKMQPDAISSEFYIYKYDRTHPSLLYKHKDGVSVEERLFGGYRKTSYCFPSPSGPATFRTIHEDGIGADYGCFISSSLSTWLGKVENNFWTSILAERLCCSEVISNILMNGERCDVATYQHPNDSSLVDVIYLSAAGFLVGWDHYQINDTGVWVQEPERRYSIISCELE